MIIGIYIIKLAIAITAVISIIGIIRLFLTRDSYNVGYHDMESHLIGTRFKKHDIIEFNPYRDDFESWCVKDDLKKTKGSRAP